MKSIRNYMVVIFTVLLAGNAAGQAKETDEKKNYSKHGIGAVLSSSNGKGLAYRYWPKNFGVQVSFIP